MFVEISYLIGEKETVIIESLSKPRLIPRTRMTEGKKNNTSILEMSTHNGTHLDAPYHIDPNGLTIDAMNINDFIFEKPCEFQNQFLFLRVYSQSQYNLP